MHHAVVSYTLPESFKCFTLIMKYIESAAVVLRLSRSKYPVCGSSDTSSISYPESSGFLASGWSPGKQPLAKEPEDSGYDIDSYEQCLLNFGFILSFDSV